MQVHLEFSERQKELLEEKSLHTSSDSMYSTELLEEWLDIVEDWMDDYMGDFEEVPVPKKTLEIENLFDHINDFLIEVGN